MDASTASTSLTVEERQARLDALTNRQRARVLAYLSGATPELVDAALAYLATAPGQ